MLRPAEEQGRGGEGACVFEMCFVSSFLAKSYSPTLRPLIPKLQR